MAYDFQSDVPTNYGMHEKKQIPCVMNMLTRDLILPRKGPVNRKSPGNRPKVNLNNSRESKHVTTAGAQCQKCKKILSNRAALRKHVDRYHGQDKELDKVIKSKMVKVEPGLYKCCDCSYTSAKSSTMVCHIESKHVTTAGAKCANCKKICRTREALRKHVDMFHRV